MGRCQKVPKFQGQFFRSNTIGIFLNFFSLKNTIVLIHVLITSIFELLYYLIDAQLMTASHYTTSENSMILGILIFRKKKTF